MVLAIPIKITFCTLLFLSENTFIFSVSILIITIQLFLFFDSSIPSGYYCPRCQSHEIIVYQDHIECTDCKLNFPIENLLADIETENAIDKENILAEEELHGVLGTFTKEERRRLGKILEEDDFY